MGELKEGKVGVGRGPWGEGMLRRAGRAGAGYALGRGDGGLGDDFGGEEGLVEDEGGVVDGGQVLRQGEEQRRVLEVLGGGERPLVVQERRALLPVGGRSRASRDRQRAGIREERAQRHGLGSRDPGEVHLLPRALDQHREPSLAGVQLSHHALALSVDVLDPGIKLLQSIMELLLFQHFNTKGEEIKKKR